MIKEYIFWVPVLFKDGVREQVVDIKCYSQRQVPLGSQALSLLYSAFFEEPYQEVIEGRIRQGIEDIDFIHEVFGHSYQAWKKGCKNQLSWAWYYIWNKKKLEADAYEQEESVEVFRVNQHSRGRLLNPLDWSHFRRT